MAGLRLQKRLASSVLKCGRNKVWMDPNEVSQIGMATSRSSVKKLIKNGWVLRINPTVHSRSRARTRLEEKRRGRHMGRGKRRGCKDARMPTKVMWIRRQRVLRRLLKKYRKQRKIDQKLYHRFYLAAKGNQFKNKKVLIETIQKEKAEKLREQRIKEEQELRRKKNLEKRERKLAKRNRFD